MRKIIRALSYYATPVLCFYLVFFDGSHQALNDLGWWSLYTLLVIMFVKPIAVLSGNKFLYKMVSYRRELGVFCFWTGFAHSFGWWQSIGFDIDWSITSPLAWGYVAMFLIFVTGITSNNLSLKLLQKHWKTVQYLAYPALLATMLHIEMIKYGTWQYSAGIFGVYAVLKMLEKIKIKKATKVS